MELNKTHARFETTSWTLVREVSVGGERCERAAAELMRRYWPAVYAYLRGSGMRRDEAEEATQGFFTDVVLARGLIERADPDRGRLRTFILTSLKRYLVDQYRRVRARGGGRVASIEAFDREEDAWGASSLEGVQAFDRRWAVAQLEEAIRRCESHFLSNGKAGHWEAFEDRVYRPAVVGSTPSPLAELAPRCGFRTPADAAAAVQVVKKRALTLLREVVAESVADPSEIEREYRDTLTLLRT